MAWDGWLLAALLVLTLLALATNRVGADVVFVGVLLALILAGILTPEEAFAGFSSGTVALVAFLYVIAVGLDRTGAMARIVARVMGGAKGTFEAQARLVLPVAALSAFMNNTPIVAVFLPVLDSTARRLGISASKLFLPLSYAAILGGVCTLIGTSTNVIVAGLMKAEGFVPFGMFDLSRVGVPVCVAGVVYMLIFGRRLLPDNADRDASATPREYMVSLRVANGAPFVGRSIDAAGFRNLPGLFLAAIERGEQELLAVGPDETLRAGDVLRFVGRLDSVVDLQKTAGLVPIEHDATTFRHKNNLIEAVISATSPLVGVSIKDAGVRTRYGAVVIAVHRHGHRLPGKIGAIVLRAGDTLLLEAPRSFLRAHRDSSDFHLVSAVEGAVAPRHERAWIAIALLGLLIVLLSFELLHAVTSAMLVAALMGLTRCYTGPEARRGIDWTVLIVIGAAFGLVKAMEKTGLAAAIATEVVEASSRFGPRAILAAVYALTTLFTMFITNNAAAILVFPIALSVAKTAGLDFTPFAAAIAIGASCEFSTPVGYQTNLMVMGPGGYVWADYLRFGAPLTLLCGALTVALAPLVY